jgi:hypothetical protein
VIEPDPPPDDQLQHPASRPFTGTHFPGDLPRKRNLSRERSRSNAACGPCNKAGVRLRVRGGSEPLTGYRYGNDPNRTASQAVTDVSRAGDSAADRSIALSVMGMEFRAG